MTLVELATGRRPQMAATLDLDSITADPTATLRFAASGAAVLPVPDIPEWLAPAVERCIQVDPAARWADMETLDKALASLVAHGPGLREMLGIEEEPVVPQYGKLPTPTDPLLGREQELSALLAALSSPGIVTLRGPAGIGKSRLALEAAHTLQAAHETEAWFCELAPVHNEAGLVAAVASNLGMRLPDHDATQAVGRALASRGPLVLVLDNFEQIVQLRDCLATWCEQASQLRVLVTSRVPIERPRERVVDLGPLSVTLSAELIAARARLRGVHIEVAELQSLAMKLEGVPLALELAAGRLGVLSPADVEQRLGDGILRSGEEGRHGTLAGALELSWALLKPSEKQALVDLTVFVGGFDSGAAEAVGVGLNELESLHRQSLLRTQDGRLDMFVSVRAFAATKAERHAAIEAHGDYFASLGTDAQLQALRTHGAAQAHRELAADLDNLEAACRRGIARADGEVATLVLRAIWGVLAGTGPFLHAAELAEQVLELTLTPLQRARASYVAAEALQRAGELARAQTHAQRCVDDIAGRPKERLHAEAQHTLGLIQQYVGDVEASQDCLGRAEALYASWGDRGGQASTAASLGTLAFLRGELSAAVPFLKQAMDLATEVGNRKLLAAAAGNLGIVYRNMGRLDEAMTQYRLAVDVRRELQDPAGEARALGSRAVAHQEAGDVEAAQADYERSLALARSTGDRPAEANAIGNLATLVEECGELARARSLYEEGIALHATIGDPRHLGVMVGNLANLLIELGEVEEAVVRLHRAVELSKQAGDRRLQGHWLVERSRLLPIDQASSTLGEATVLLGGTGDRPMLANLATAHGDLALRRGRLDEARQCLAQAIELSPDADELARSAVKKLARRIELAECG